MVVDSETGKPIPSVNIFSAGTTVGTMTDSTGVFTLSIPTGKQVIVVSHVAYNKEEYDTEISPGKEMNVKIQLTPNPININEMTITSTKPPEEAMATYVIGEKEVESTSGSQFGDVLRRYAPSVLLAQAPLARIRRQATFTLYVNQMHWDATRYNDLDPLQIKKVLVWKRAYVPIQFKLDYGTSYLVHVLTKP